MPKHDYSTYVDVCEQIDEAPMSEQEFRDLGPIEQRQEIENIEEIIHDLGEPDPDYDRHDIMEPIDDPYTSSGPDYWQNEDGEWRCG